MEKLKKLNIEFQNYLDEISGSFTDDLTNILNDENIRYLGDHSKADIKAFYFEYEYDYLNLVCWAVNASGEIIIAPMMLPEKNDGKNSEADRWNAFIPEDIWNEAAEFCDSYEEEDADDLLDEYNDEKYTLFENWFFECWKKAAAATENKTDAYFSIHDTYFRTDLVTFETINDDDIAKRYR
ncbi:hypothetical protein [Chryseobacterium sp.]|uniref:hypothetical protein n=1 Tax=Chryseobacterium sp. TaxID=1871047 RepID=UPI0025C00433|nr:hypothetical protein [Chryseobacterium sp.]MBV8326244.1 hypothetical protein [Chryseobacterium sp.]